MTGLTLRDARDTDQAAIREITLAAYQEYASVRPELWDLYRQDMLRTLADIGPAEQIVAELDGAMVGTVLLVPADAPAGGPAGARVRRPWPEIRLLAVAPAARGRGIGAALVHECMRRVRQAGLSAITLHTTDMMAVAQAMYLRMGFVPAPELDFQPAPGFLVKGYRLQLDPPAA
jgi:GNAT superfamily N-acetyltransferase